MVKMLPESIYNTPAIEAWLSDQARRGWWVQRISGERAAFQRGEPGECRFRLEPQMDRPERPDEELLDLYGDMGWEFGAAYGDELYLWRSVRPDARELHTDPVAQGMAYDGLARILKRRMWTYGVRDVLFLGLLVYALLIRPTGVLNMAKNGLSLVPFSLFAMLWSSGVLLFDMRTLRILRRTLGTGITPERTAPRGGRKAAWLVYYIVVVLLFAGSLLYIFTDQGEELDALTPDMPVVSLADLGVDGAVSFDGRRWENVAVSSYIQCWQDTDAYRGPVLGTQVFDLRLGFLAGRPRKGHTANIRQWSGQAPQPLEDARFDELYYLQSGEPVPGGPPGGAGPVSDGAPPPGGPDGTSGRHRRRAGKRPAVSRPAVSGS